jgi:hypothetical protein
MSDTNKKAEFANCTCSIFTQASETTIYSQSVIDEIIKKAKNIQLELPEIKPLPHSVQINFDSSILPDKKL